MYSKPPVISDTSLRGRAMARAAQREKEIAQTRLPGYRAARLTRAYTPEDVAQGKGMSAQRLRQIAARGVQSTPILVRHRMDLPPAARPLGADFDPASEFFHLRTQLTLGDGASGDYVAAEQEKGNLLYMSAKFTVPEPNDPHPERFESQLVEASFVDEPHEPHAQILVAHSTTDSQHPTRVLNLCSRIANTAQRMSSSSAAAAAAAAEQDGIPKDAQAPIAKKPATFGGLTADEIRTLIEQNKQLVAEKEAAAEKLQLLEFYQQRHTASMEPKLNAITEALEADQDLHEDDRNMVRGFFQEASVDHRTAPVVEWGHRVMSQLAKARAEQAKLAEQREATETTAADLSEALRAMQSSSSSSPASFAAGMTPSQARALAGGQQPTVPTPLMAAHSAGSSAVPHRAGGPTRLSDKMFERIRRHAEAFNDGTPEAKRRATVE